MSSTAKTGTVTVGSGRIEVLSDGGRFIGLGAAWIGDKQVRSGRLPLRPVTQAFSGAEIDSLTLIGVDQNAKSARVKVEASFRKMPVQLMRDHSFDPIHDLADWDQTAIAGKGTFDIVIEPASDTFQGTAFEGFSYRYEYKSDDIALFYILDLASWELDGNIEGGVAISQSSCSSPIAYFGKDTAWSTEGILHFLVEEGNSNPIMTHNLPRWASHGSFDYQFKGGDTLIGVFEKVSLVRSIQQRDAGKPELKMFDKYIFDQAKSYVTPRKSILLNRDAKSDIDQRNLWTWIQDVVYDRARAEYGLYEEPQTPRLSWNYWEDFTVDSYYKDLLPAAIAIGAKQLFVDNLNKSSMTERSPSEAFHWNMCCGHEYELAPRLGGPKGVKAFVDACQEHGIRPYSWTNNDQSYGSPVNFSERDERGWFVKMEDCRLKYGGAYTNCFTILDFKADAPRQYWVDCLKKNKEVAGLDGYLFDSFYNLGFMPVSYSEMNPTTQWHELLLAFKELQDAGVSFLIESLGPFGQVQHGVPTSYNFENLFACYKIGMGTGYTTVPTGETLKRIPSDQVSVLYHILAHKTDPGLQLFIDGKRIDKVWTETHKRVLAEYLENLPLMKRRFLQEDGQSVLWHDETGQRATLFNFEPREVSLSGRVTDLSTGHELPTADTYALEPLHTYAIMAHELPVRV